MVISGSFILCGNVFLCVALRLNLYSVRGKKPLLMATGFMMASSSFLCSSVRHNECTLQYITPPTTLRNINLQNTVPIQQAPFNTSNTWSCPYQYITNCHTNIRSYEISVAGCIAKQTTHTNTFYLALTKTVLTVFDCIAVGTPMLISEPRYK